MFQLQNNLETKNGWEIIEKAFDKDMIVTTGSNFMIGNGYLGYRGTFAEWQKDEYVACIVSDTYDSSGGQWRELCNAPNALFTQIILDDEIVSIFNGKITDYERQLSFKHGILTRSMTWESSSSKKVTIREEKFASYDNLHLIPMKYIIEPHFSGNLVILTGIDGDVWDLYGPHFVDYQNLKQNNSLVIETKTGEFNTIVDVAESNKINGTSITNEEIITKNKSIFKKITVNVTQGEKITLEKYIIVYSSNDVENPKEKALVDVETSLKMGYDKLKENHMQKWEKIWSLSDIIIEGDLEAQTLLRFNLYQSIIATPTHDYLPIGARGLSCQTYQGAAFWDQEIFNMPMFLYTRPEIARNLLIYRYNTLDGARAKAKRLGYYGAFYPWMSGKTGDELCPSYFFKDVLTGRPIHNHFNDWQIHISPDIAYAIWQYYQATSDWTFIVEYGAEILFEIAQFFVSHVYFKKDKNRYEFIRLLGPDEYHENVDNNAFTNYQAQFTQRTAVAIYERMKKDFQEELTKLMKKLALSEKDVENWREMQNLIYLPHPDEDSLLIEQFDGYFDLEDITPEELKKRLKDPGEYWGWPNGIAVETQVMKQADVIQLFVLHNIFDYETIKANFDYYEKRDQRGSSLSPSAYATIAANIGYRDKAYDLFIESCSIDLYNTSKAVSGGTFLGGIHTASCGAAWQIIVKGFAGFHIEENGQIIHFNPKLPDKWNRIVFWVKYRNNTYEITIDRHSIIIVADKKNTDDVRIMVGEEPRSIQPGEKTIFAI
jgi:trehalose/maltose hydrolase-like predicted phosphorylase